MELEPQQLKEGTDLFLKEITRLQEDDPDLSDFATAFEEFCARKFSLGSTASDQRTGGKNDQGIDFYSSSDHTYRIGQCKTPLSDYLESYPHKPKIHGPQGISDLRNALRYLIGESKANANERVKFLYSCIEKDRNSEDFQIIFLLIVYGRLDKRAKERFDELKQEYQKHRINIRLYEIDDLIEQFSVGSERETGDIRFTLGYKEEVLRQLDYCYCLVNAGDIFAAFHEFGWRLVDLNLRYEIRNSPVNGDIVKSLKYQVSRRKFHYFNNGVIIIVKNYSINEKENKISLRGAQIVNGLQTVKSIYNAVGEKEVRLEDLKKDCFVQVKIIQSQDKKFISNIVQHTNNQNPMTARNLKGNTLEQKELKKKFKLLSPRWFYQVKEGEWESLSQEDSRFFKQTVGFPPSEFKPDAKGKRGRIIDNEHLGKAWLAFIGYADLAGDRVGHYFTNDNVYQKIFLMSPVDEYWQKFGVSDEFNYGREDLLRNIQANAEQYLLAYLLWQYTRFFIPSSRRYREIALEEGVKSKHLKKSGGTITSADAEKDAWLAENETYQTWRLMDNMKTLLVEVASRLLVQKYGPLTSEVSSKILKSFDAVDFIFSGDIRVVAQQASEASDLKVSDVFGRIYGLLKFTCKQFWIERRTILMATSRVRTMLLSRDKAADFKKLVSEVSGRKGLDKAWKPEGKTFLESLPNLN